MIKIVGGNPMNLVMDIKTMIVKETNEVLKQKAKVITPNELKKGEIINALIASRKFVSDDGSHALGLALPQLGISKRGFVAKLRVNDEYITEIFINPTIVPLDNEKETDMEGCLSIEGVQVDVERFYKIKIIYKGINNKTKSLILKGLNARVVQHELDHLNGILITDRGSIVKEEKVVG